MTLLVQFPDALQATLFLGSEDPSRSVVESVALEGYRSGRLTESEVRLLLGFETRAEVHGFLKEHGAYLDYSSVDLEHDGAVALALAQRA